MLKSQYNKRDVTLIGAVLVATGTLSVASVVQWMPDRHHGMTTSASAATTRQWMPDGANWGATVVIAA